MAVDSTDQADIDPSAKCPIIEALGGGDIKDGGRFQIGDEPKIVYRIFHA
ncbi:hypothetical protein [Rhizobium leguminosarum]|nr:hypothetical protein [Rhizobium leguminosarum]